MTGTNQPDSGRWPKVLLSEDIHASGKAMLAGKAEIILAPDTTTETAERLIADADALILRASTRLTRGVLDHAKCLKIVARTGVGYNNVDIEACVEKGIPVTIVPGANDNAVAEHVLAMILALAKQVPLMDAAVRTGDWNQRFSPRQIEISGRTLGLIGLGRIGLLVARKASALGMKLAGYDPYLRQGPEDLEITLHDHMEDVFRSACFLSLHVPATPETTGLINRERLALLNRGSYLINTSRGELLDNAALVWAMKSGLLAGAAIDVFQQEPPSVGDPLLSLPNVILSPHAAGSSSEANERLATGAAQAVLDVLEGRVPPHVVNQSTGAKNFRP